MSYQRGTTHYTLPQTIGTDKRDWSDTNQAFTDVDAALYAAAQDASTAAGAVTALDTRLTTQEGKMSTAEGKIAALEASDTTQDTTLLQHGQKIQALENATTDIDITPTNVKTGVNIQAVKRNGNLVHIAFNITSDYVPGGENDVLFNIPAGDTPSYSLTISNTVVTGATMTINLLNTGAVVNEVHPWNIPQ